MSICECWKQQCRDDASRQGVLTLVSTAFGETLNLLGGDDEIITLVAILATGWLLAVVLDKLIERRLDLVVTVDNGLDGVDEGTKVVPEGRWLALTRVTGVRLCVSVRRHAGGSSQSRSAIAFRRIGGDRQAGEVDDGESQRRKRVKVSLVVLSHDGPHFGKLLCGRSAKRAQESGRQQDIGQVCRSQARAKTHMTTVSPSSSR